MFRILALTALLTGALAVALPVAPASAVTSKEKMDTCKFGADSQKLTGAKRNQFIKRCMSNKDDPRGTPATEKK